MRTKRAWNYLSAAEVLRKGGFTIAGEGIYPPIGWRWEDISDDEADAIEYLCELWEMYFIGYITNDK